MKRIAFGVLAVVCGLILALVFLETASTLYLTVKDGKFVSAHQRFEAADHPWFQGTINRPTDTYYCAHIYTLFPHPYLGWVYHGNPPCGYPKSINNIGLHRHNFPPPRIHDKYVVLLTGGSVSEYVGGGNQQYVGGGLHPPYLERALNEHWVGPNGKPFLVLQGGAGGWKQPQAAIMFMLYADMVDAVVTLDGANELGQLRLPHGERFEYPFLHFQEVNPLATDEFSTVVAKWMLSRFVTYLRTTIPFSYSSAAFIVADRLDRIAESETNQHSGWRTTVQSIFAAPKGWTDQQSWTAGLEQYRKYIREMHAIAKTFQVREAYFIQPVAAVDKPLSSYERARGFAATPAYSRQYLEMTDSLLGLRKDGIPVYSLRDVFEHETESIYADPVHSLWDDKTQESRGYTLIAERMARELANAWHLKRKDIRTSLRQ